jgi:hypothetical protein
MTDFTVLRVLSDINGTPSHIVKFSHFKGACAVYKKLVLEVPVDDTDNDWFSFSNIDDLVYDIEFDWLDADKDSLFDSFLDELESCKSSFEDY